MMHLQQVETDVKTRSSFTGKELDEETGFGYFGARYMDHELMTGWLSVDPMADKYPNISPYAYCAWNPMKLVDPDGNDVWNLQEDGTLVWVEASKNEKILMGDHSVFNTNPIFGTYNEAGTKIDLSKATMNFGNNQSQAEMYFEFFADNLDFEFSLLGYSDKGKEKFEVTTSLNKTGDARGSARAYELSSNGILFLHAHNHPSGGYNNSTPVNHASVGNDIDFRNNIQKEGKSPNCRFYVYSKDYGGLYFDYTSSNTEKKDGVQSRFGGKKGQYYRKSLFSPLNRKTTMKKTILMMLLNIFVAGVFQSKAQQPLFSYCGPLEPSQVRCCQNDNVELFREYLSLFKVNGKQKRSKIDSFEWWNPKWEPIDSQYEQFVFKVPGFFVYPAFRIDCKNGFLVGLKNGYACDKMRLYYVDLVSYDKSGRIIGRTTLPTFQMANFHTDDSCGYSYQQLLSRLDIENGLIIFEFGTLRACYSDLERADTIISETIVKEGRKYVYRIEDDASLTLISATEPQENQ